MKPLACVSLFLALPTSAGANDLVQPFDGHSGFASERNTIVPWATIADDFVVPGKSVLRRIESTFIIDPTAPPVDWEFLIYADADGMPGETIVYEAGGTAEETGTTHFGFNVVLVSFPILDIALEDGAYHWFSVRGVGDGDGRAVWASANTGDPNWSEMYFRSDFFGQPDWVPGSKQFGDLYDTAWTLTFIPGPGGFVLLLGAGLLGRRRRG